MAEQEEFPCDETRKLNDAVAFKFLPGARSTGTWSRLHSWMQKFFKFAHEICKKSAVRKSPQQCIASNVMCRHFIAAVANEKRGASRARSARAALSKYRMARGLQSLNKVPAISAVVDAAEAAQPRTKKQSAGLTVAMVKYVKNAWGSSSSWWKSQIALLMLIGFISIMRLGELCAVRRSGIRVTFRDGSERSLASMRVLPRPEDVQGVLIHLPWRKNHKAMDCWIPVACPTAIAMLIRHEYNLRKSRCSNKFLFTSRVRKAGGYVRHAENPVGAQSAIKAMQNALLECVPFMTRKWARLYTGHCLRVGGSNHMRKLGISDDIHRRLGGWMQLVSAQGYMALSPREQYSYTVRLAQSKRRRSAMTASAAARCLPFLRVFTIE